MRRTLRIILVSAVVVAAQPLVAKAQLVWRVSVKVVLDENDNRAVDGVTFNGCCDLNTDAEIQAKIDDANAILRGLWLPDVPVTEPRGYQLDLLEIVDLADLPAPPSDIRACANDGRQFCTSSTDCGACVGGTDAGDFCERDSDCTGGTCTGTAACSRVSYWFYAPIIREVRNAIRDAATVDAASRAVWGWRDDAINIYILGSDGSGTAYDTILIGQDLASPNTPFHEVGHFFNLDHTHGGGGSSADCVSVVDDYVADTLGDNCGPGWMCGGCWDQDQIANWNWPTQCSGPCDYVDLSTADQLAVDRTFFNLMCYRGRREVLTPGQLDRMTDHSNSVVNHVASGYTRFVDWHAGTTQSGTSLLPYRTVGAGLAHAAAGDIVLVRWGTYGETMTIDQPVTLRATGGTATIGAP